MNLNGPLKELYSKRDRLVAIIAELETLARSMTGRDPGRRSNRGRMFMGPAERRAVSERMKKYWAARRSA